MKIIEKRKATIRKSNHYYNNGNAIRCDDDPLFSERGVNIQDSKMKINIFSGKYFEHYALRITR